MEVTVCRLEYLSLSCLSWSLPSRLIIYKNLLWFIPKKTWQQNFEKTLVKPELFLKFQLHYFPAIKISKQKIRETNVMFGRKLATEKKTGWQTDPNTEKDTRTHTHTYTKLVTQRNIVGNREKDSDTKIDSQNVHMHRQAERQPASQPASHTYKQTEEWVWSNIGSQDKWRVQKLLDPVYTNQKYLWWTDDCYW